MDRQGRDQRLLGRGALDILMKDFLKIAAISILCLSACTAEPEKLTPAQATEIRGEVNAAFEGLAEASQTLNHEAYFSYFDAEKYTALNENGEVLHSFKAFKDIYEPQLGYLESYQNLEFNNVKIDVIDASTAVLVNEYEATVTLKSGETISAAGAGTQVWSKRTGSWKLVNVSSSAKPQLENPILLLAISRR